MEENHGSSPVQGLGAVDRLLKLQARFGCAFRAAAALFVAFIAWPMFGLELTKYTIGFAWTLLGLSESDLREAYWVNTFPIIQLLVTGLAAIAYVVYAAVALIVAKTILTIN